MSEYARVKALTKPLLVITGILGIIHFFIWQIVTTSMVGFEKWSIGLLFLMALLLLPVGVMLSYTPLREKLRGITYFSYVWLGFFHLMFHLSLIELVIFLIRPHKFSYWVLIMALLITLWSLFKGFSFPKVNRYQLRAPAFLKGKTIIQISDLHIGMLHLNQNWLEKVVKKINLLNPDFVAITGDLVEGPYQKISPQLEPLSKLSAKNKFYVTGNHEYIHFSENWEWRLEQLGFKSLHNSSIILNVDTKDLMFAGVPDRMVQRFTSTHITSNPDLALTGPADFKVLLAHEPSSVFDLKTEKPDVILSGHTHGGQIFPFTFYVRLQQPVSKGFKRINSILVFAHQGTGFWGPPMRWFTDSEIAVFEFVE